MFLLFGAGWKKRQTISRQVSKHLDDNPADGKWLKTEESHG